MANPLIFQAIYYAVKKSQGVPKVCSKCKNYRKGHDYCKAGRYTRDKEYHCSDLKRR